MAFPPLAGLGPSAGAAALDGPPPSPTPMGATAGAPGDFSMRGLASQLPSTQMPPEVLTGIMQSAQPVVQLFDSWAQIAPDLGGDIELLKTQLQGVLAKLMQSGAGAVSPTAPGPAFPGGGIDQGVPGPGSV